MMGTLFRLKYGIPFIGEPFMKHVVLALALCLSTSVFAASSQRLTDPADFCHIQGLVAGKIITMKHQGAQVGEIVKNFHDWYEHGKSGIDEVRQRMVTHWYTTWGQETFDKWFEYVYNKYDVDSGEAYTYEKIRCQERNGAAPE